MAGYLFPVCVAKTVDRQRDGQQSAATAPMPIPDLHPVIHAPPSEGALSETISAGERTELAR
ncbi:hypothetical protein [Nocardia africana]